MAKLARTSLVLLVVLLVGTSTAVASTTAAAKGRTRMDPDHHRSNPEGGTRPRQRAGARRTTTLVLAVGLLLSSLALPASAVPRETLDDPWFYLVWTWYDEDTDLLVFWNTTRDAWCDWLDAGTPFDERPAIELVPIRYHEVADGILVRSFNATRYAEVWLLGEHDDVCGDLDGPFAVGTANVRNNDNDWEEVGGRATTWGHRGNGTLVDGDGGTWHLNWASRAMIVQGEYHRPVHRATFTRRGPR
jgi:hypothetical protein